MRKNHTFLAVLLANVFAIAVTSCGDDFLDKNPKLAVTEDDLLSTEELIDATMAGVYTRFQSCSFGGGGIAVI
ncbi:MAG: hypothetical protein J6W69_08105, partial [Bacteroidales bacterium]|nr:hypothetical protein [Bacteroidales bacterium]